MRDRSRPARTGQTIQSVRQPTCCSGRAAVPGFPVPGFCVEPPDPVPCCDGFLPGCEPPVPEPPIPPPLPLPLPGVPLIPPPGFEPPAGFGLLELPELPGFADLLGLFGSLMSLRSFSRSAMVLPPLMMSVPGTGCARRVTSVTHQRCHVRPKTTNDETGRELTSSSMLRMSVRCVFLHFSAPARASRSSHPRGRCATTPISSARSTTLARSGGSRSSARTCSSATDISPAATRIGSPISPPPRRTIRSTGSGAFAAATARCACSTRSTTTRGGGSRRP